MATSTPTADSPATPTAKPRKRRLKRALVITASVIGGLALVVGALGAWFLYSPMPAEPELAATVETHALTVDGLERTYTTVVPDDLPADAPMILAFHGSNANGAQMRTMTGYRFDELAVERGFIAVYPDGYRNTWHDCRTSTPYPARLDDIDDVAFTEAIIGATEAEYGIDRSRVFATGLSNGGHFSMRLGAERPDLVKAFAAFAAAYPEASNFSCTDSTTPEAAMFVLGTADPINPFTGGEASAFGTDLGMVNSADDSARLWAERNGITAEPVVTRVKDGVETEDGEVTRTVYGADTAAPVVLYAVEGGGHVVPNPKYSQPRIMGGTTQDLDGPLAAVEFFLGLG
ncbi:polyhydroxybutyrate depolymerase [Agromyces sp. CF514]|uniref:alpha/beta hydrolase family esterase n=1 Tax=Agromyces sp. CF514 TaxID=1881031 RepID=UPI0008EAF060|nr:PHB depolymerase family esterase [Agromyces sp. CF514]SFR74915.1 polyhydroxybutyrate depolymerase [Agromyces sp. CF514]